MFARLNDSPSEVQFALIYIWLFDNVFGHVYVSLCCVSLKDMFSMEIKERGVRSR